MTRFSLLFVALAACSGGAGAPDGAAAPAAPDAPAGEDRIVSIGGNITETIYALGKGSVVVAVDRTSVYPAEADKLPKVGLPASISVEGVAAQRPTLVIADGSAPNPALDQLSATGIKVATLAKQPSTPEGAAARIKELGALLGKSAEADVLAKALLDKVSATTTTLKDVTERPKVLFVYARGQRTLLVAGDETPAKAMIELAGATNAVSGFTDFKPMSAEVVLAAKPDVIVIPQRGLDSLGGIDGLIALPGIAETPAGQAKRVIAIDDLEILGFGPRLGDGLGKLAKALHPERFGGTNAR